MTNAMTDVLKQEIVDHIIETYSYSVILYATLPSFDAEGVEVEAPGYVRQPVAFESPAPGILCNASSIVFSPTASWPPVVGAGVRDHDGRLHWYGAIDPPREPGPGENLGFASGDISMSLS